MADQPITTPPEDETNPFAPPRSDLNDRSGIGDPEAEALRSAHLQEESYVKALTIVNFVYFFFFGSMVANYAWILISHLRGRANAPWIVRPGFVAFQLIYHGLPIYALGATWGFFRRKRWALRFEFLVALGLFLSWGLAPLISSTPTPIVRFIAATVMILAIASPMLNISDLRSSVIFNPEYADAIARTPHIRVMPKLSLDLKLIAVLLIVVAVILFGFAS